MANIELLKQAADAIRDLRGELESIKEAKELALELYKKGHVPAERALELMQEYESKSTEELEIIKKAMELRRNSEFSLGNLSDRPQDDGTLDPLTAWILE